MHKKTANHVEVEDIKSKISENSLNPDLTIEKTKDKKGAIENAFYL